MDNLSIYNKVRSVPKEALKEIQAGRLKGKSDINPMWRIKILTEQFGICGIGWKYTIEEKRLEKADNGEISAFVDINLYVKVDGAWSEPIPGTGGSSFVAQEKNGPYVSDECFKMALTDAISVSCKALGFGADVYWDKDNTKYTPREEHKPSGNDSNRSHIDTGSEGKATKQQYLDLYNYAIKTKGWPKEQLQTTVDNLFEAKKISSKYSKKYGTDEIIWTVKDIETIREEIDSFPF